MITRLLSRPPVCHFKNQIRRCASTLSGIKVDDATVRKLKYLPGDRVHGFICTNSRYIPEFNMTTFVFRHEKTGLEYLHVDRADSNNVFSINFRTTPFNSTGLAHILEHNVLCGSRKFPVRDPFFKMLNRSLQTFMNAMTGPDYTLYPFSTTNESDYRNLQSIYLDAVFKPNLKYLDFLQEGWRLEHSNLNDKNSDLTFKGVVYNEMKGAFSENSRVFGEQFFNTILPDHTYGFCSGGDPLEIPQLTHKDLVDFHSRYYHPSNARMYSYGNFNLKSTLEFVNKEYLADVKPIDPSYSVVPGQKRWTQPKFKHIQCRFDNMGAPIEKQNHWATGYLMTDIRDVYENFVVHILTELLVKGPNSYFYKSLIEPNISGGYSQMTGFDSQIRDTMFIVGLQDVSATDFDKCQKIFDQTIHKVLEKGFDRQHVESVLHNIELLMKHQTTRFGLGMLFNLTALWNHGDGNNLIQSMCVGETLQTFRENLTRDPKYLEKQVEKYFIQNRHQLVMTMSPDLEFEAKFNAKEAELLQEKIKNLTNEDKERVYRDGLALAESQKSEQDLNLLPCLKVEDIKKDLEPIVLEHPLIRNVPTQICLADTNGVSYFRSILDASALTQDEKVLLPLFASVADQFGTKLTDYRDFDKRINSKTAGLTFNVQFAEHVQDKSKYELGLLVGTYALKENVPQMFEILAELLNNFDPSDEERFKMLLENYVSQLSIGIADSGHLYAMQAAAGLVTEASQLKEAMMGVQHLEYMKKLLEEKSVSEILKIIKSIAVKLFQESSVRCALNISESEKQESVQLLDGFLSSVRPNLGESSEILHNSRLLESSSKHSVMTIPVNYCAKSLATVSFVHPDFAALRVLARLLSSKYLLPVVREQNGAYGAGAKIASDGLFNFFSYRDPNSVKTLQVFNDASKWLQDYRKKLDEQTLFEAKLGVMQQLDIPIAPKDKGMNLFLYRITQEMFAKHRQDILAVSVNDLGRVSEKYLAPGAVKNVGQCVLGPDNEDLKKFLFK